MRITKLRVYKLYVVLGIVVVEHFEVVAANLVAVDLPLRSLISSEDNKTMLRYYNPLHMAKEHKLDRNLDVINKVSGLLNAIVMEAAGKA